MNKPLIKNIFYYIGCISLFAAGLFYVLAADLMLTTQSIWLMIAIILSFSSSVFAVLSETYREKKALSYSFKGLAMGIAVAFITYLVVYLLIALSPERTPGPNGFSSFEQSFMIKRIRDSKKDTVFTLIVMIITSVISLIGVVGQVTELIMTVKIKEE